MTSGANRPLPDLEQPHRQHGPASTSGNVSNPFANSLGLNDTSHDMPSHERDQRVDDDDADEITRGDEADVQREEKVLAKTLRRASNIELMRNGCCSMRPRQLRRMTR